MTDLFGLIETFGPVIGLLLFIALKQIQIGSVKPKLASIEDKLDRLLQRTEDVSAKQSNESDDSGCTLPTQETIR